MVFLSIVGSKHYLLMTLYHTINITSRNRMNALYWTMLNSSSSSSRSSALKQCGGARGDADKISDALKR